MNELSKGKYLAIMLCLTIFDSASVVRCSCSTILIINPILQYFCSGHLLCATLSSAIEEYKYRQSLVNGGLVNGGLVNSDPVLGRFSSDENCQFLAPKIADF